MQFHLEQSRIDDALKLAEVHIQCWREAYTGILHDEVLDQLNLGDRRRGWEKNLKQPYSNSIRYTLKQGSRIIGFCGAGEARDPHMDYAGEIYAIYILSEFKGRGLGKWMMKILGKWLLSQDYNDCYVWVLAENPTRRFYEACSGVLLPNTKELQFGGVLYQEVCYGYAESNALEAISLKDSLERVFE